MKRLVSLIHLLWIPVIAAAGIIGYLMFLHVLDNPLLAHTVIGTAIILGSLNVLRNTLVSLFQKKFALDYIAILAIVTGVISGELLVSAIIVLMVSGGEALEKFAISRAKKSLTALSNRIPNSVLLWKDNDIGKRIPIADVAVGEAIFVRKGEVIPLDGRLISADGLADESSLTGEPYEMEKIRGDSIRSGTINIGKPMVIEVTASDKDSTYRKIIDMVSSAQKERSPLIRIADRYSTVFTLVTLFFAVLAYVVSGNPHHVLAVLVIATPCPLILATPIALIGGMSALARRKIIVKNLVSIETLSRVTDIMFDKTGTITLGRPVMRDVVVYKTSYTRSHVLAIAGAIERNSLHPLAKALVSAAKKAGTVHVRAQNVSERIGYGITGAVGGKEYVLSKREGDTLGLAIELKYRGTRIADFFFEDKIKGDSSAILKRLKRWGMRLSIYTGDTRQSAERLLSHLSGVDITIATDCSPGDKLHGIKRMRNQGRVTAMVGDGINDAPAIAAADVGMVFSSGEHTAASEAADLVFLGGDLTLVMSALAIGRRTVAIAFQSIGFGIGLSVLGMVFAAFGYIPAIAGALIQEGIDIAVILNALRASK